jgi:hypothetical protein
MVTVGGISTKPRYIDGELQPRELLDLTISVDHEIVEGAPPARFARRLTALLGQADGLTDIALGRPEPFPGRRSRLDSLCPGERRQALRVRRVRRPVYLIRFVPA